MAYFICGLFADVRGEMKKKHTSSGAPDPTMSSPTPDATKPSTPADDVTVSPGTRKGVKRTKEEIVDDLTVDGVAAFSLTHPRLKTKKIVGRKKFCFTAGKAGFCREKGNELRDIFLFFFLFSVFFAAFY